MAARTVRPACAAPEDGLSPEDQRRVAELRAELAQLQEAEAMSLDDATLEALEAIEEEDDDDDIDDEDRRIDEALAVLGRTSDLAAAAVAGGFAEDLSPPNDVPSGSLVVVVGGATPLGRCLVNALATSGNGWRVRCLLGTGESVGDAAGASVETVSAAPSALKGSLAGTTALLVVSAAAGGEGGVENDAMEALMASLPESGVRRLVYVSSHGVERTGKLPFSLQNLFGQLDQLRAAEQTMKLRAMGRVPSFSVVRVGKLLEGGDGGGGDAQERCELANGDELQGGVAAGAAGAVLVQTLTRDEVVNASFSVGPLSDVARAAAAGGTSAAQHWDDEFVRLVGPEVYRRPLAVRSADEMVGWLREWAAAFLKPDSGLTTPVDVEEAERGVTLRFLRKGTLGYNKFDEDETADQKWATAKAEQKGKLKPKADGALLLLAEAAPYPRVRVARAEMEADTLVKEMSEATILKRLDDDLKRLDR